MSTKHIRTTADLVRFGAGLRIECASCGAARTVDGFEAGKLGGVQPIEALRRRLKCSRCGAKDARLAILPPV
jgi:ribosomal protein L44E